MNRKQRTALESELGSSFRKGFDCLQPPDDESVLTEDVAKASRKIDKIVRRGLGSSNELDKLLNDIAAGSIPLSGTRSGRGSQLVNNGDPIAVFELLNELYLPGNSKSAYVPSDRRYSNEKTWPGVNGSAAAYASSGNLIATQVVGYSSPSERTRAAIYVVFDTDRYKRRISYRPEINWNTRDILDGKYTWITRSGIVGDIRMTYQVWTVAYEWNQSELRWKLKEEVAVNRLNQSFWNFGALGTSALAGKINSDAASIEFDAASNRTYTCGVLIDLHIEHTLRADDGSPIVAPLPAEYMAYGLLKAEVPAMWIHQKILP